MGDQQHSIDEKNIRLGTAETMRERIEERALVEIIIVGMGRGKGLRSPLLTNSQARPAEENNKEAADLIHLPFPYPLQRLPRRRFLPSMDWEFSWR